MQAPAAAAVGSAARIAGRLAAALVLLAVLVAAGMPVVRPTAAADSGREHSYRSAERKRIAGAETPFGREGDVRRVKRVITIEMSDAMRFFPDQVRVKKGQTVRFVVHNGGELPHEMVLGTMDDLKKHSALMKRHGEMDHDDANVAHVEPGGTGRIVWQFTKSGEFYYGCFVPGHFEAGMIGTVVVR